MKIYRHKRTPSSDDRMPTHAIYPARSQHQRGRALHREEVPLPRALPAQVLQPPSPARPPALASGGCAGAVWELPPLPRGLPLVGLDVGGVLTALVGGTAARRNATGDGVWVKRERDHAGRETALSEASAPGRKLLLVSRMAGTVCGPSPAFGGAVRQQVRSKRDWRPVEGFTASWWQWHHLRRPSAHPSWAGQVPHEGCARLSDRAAASRMQVHLLRNQEFSGEATHEAQARGQGGVACAPRNNQHRDAGVLESQDQRKDHQP